MIRKIEDKMKIRLIKEFLDLLILRRLMDAPSSGHDLMQFIIRKYMVYLSPGIIYSTLYSLEREGFVEAKSHVKKRVYSISGKGESLIKEYQASLNGIVGIAANFFKDLAAISRRETLIEKKVK